MIVTGITATQYREIVEKVSQTVYHGNLVAHVGHEYSSGRRFRARITAADSGATMFGPARRDDDTRLSAPGARKSASGRRLAAACWHAYRDVLAAIFDVNPDTRVYTAMATYRGRDDFYAQYPRTAHRDIGSMAKPAYMPELCDCSHHGIPDHEQG